MVPLQNLSQTATSGNLPNFWTDLSNAKRQHNIIMLHHALYDTAAKLGFCVPKVASPELLHIAISLTIQLEDKGDLFIALCHFFLAITQRQSGSL